MLTNIRYKFSLLPGGSYWCSLHGLCADEWIVVVKRSGSVNIIICRIDNNQVCVSSVDFHGQSITCDDRLRIRRNDIIVCVRWIRWPEFVSTSAIINRSVFSITAHPTGKLVRSVRQVPYVGNVRTCVSGSNTFEISTHSLGSDLNGWLIRRIRRKHDRNLCRHVFEHENSFYIWKHALDPNTLLNLLN